MREMRCECGWSEEGPEEGKPWFVLGFYRKHKISDPQKTVSCSSTFVLHDGGD